MPVQLRTRQEWKQLINNVTVYTMLQIYWPGVTSGSVHLDLTTQERRRREGSWRLVSSPYKVPGGRRDHARLAPKPRTARTNYWSCFCSPQVIGSLLESASGLARQNCSCRQGDSDSIPRPSPGHVTPSPPPTHISGRQQSVSVAFRSDSASGIRLNSAPFWLLYYIQHIVVWSNIPCND